MPNLFKFAPGFTGPGVLYKGGYLIANNTADYGGEFYNGIAPGPSGYTIYLNKPTGGPSIFCPVNDSEMIFYTKEASGPVFTTGPSALAWFATQTDKLCINRDYEQIVTEGLIMNVDAGYTPSYPKAGTSWYDVSPGGNNGALINDPTYSAAGGGSIVFDGSDEYALVTNPSSNILSNLTSYSISFWVQITSLAVNGSVLLSASGAANLFAQVQSATAYLGTIGAGGSYLTLNLSSISSTILNNIANIVWVKDSSTVYFYLNSTRYTYPGTANFSFVGSNNSINLGKYVDPGFNMPGSMFTSQIYNRALSQTEVSQNYYAMLNGRFLVNSGLVLNLQAGNPFSYPGSGTRWYDVSGFGNNTTLVNGPTYSGATGGSIAFDGTDDYSITLLNQTPALNITSSITLDAWIRPKALANVSHGEGIICKGLSSDGNSGVYELLLVRNGSVNIPFFRMRVGGITSAYSPSNIPMALNQIFNVVCTYNGSIMRIFVNGVESGPGLAQTGSIEANTQQLTIGVRYTHSISVNDSFFTGDISSAKIYNRSLSDSEILQNYNLQKSIYGL